MTSQGYKATEFELGDLELEESLPKFLNRREEPSEAPTEIETEVTEDAVAPADQALS